jgi:choline-sulfatase
VITRRELLWAAAAPLAVQNSAAQKNAAPAPRPNVLFIMADDLAAWMLGCYGNREIKTPHIDSLAATGMRFVNHFVCTPICSASRATFLTGRTPLQHGIHDFLTPQPIDSPPQGQKEPPASFANETMISDVLAGAGYRCGYVGKWHLGEAAKLGHGYSYSYTMAGGSSPYQNPEMLLNGQAVKEQGYLAELMTRRAGEFLNQQEAGKPFFLTVSYFNPHTPYDGHPQKYYDMYANTPFDTVGFQPPAENALREKNLMNDMVGNIRKCAASITALDDQVGALMKTLRSRGLDQNTLVVFTGDNGFLLGRHGLWSKGLASDPINMYEEVMRVPLLMSWPGKIPVQSSRPELTSAYDFVPTICDATDTPVPAKNLCGRSYLEVAQGKIFARKDAPWNNLVFGYFRNTEMARNDRFKLVIRDGGEGPCELFDVINDPRERVNQYSNPGFVTIRDRLRKELDSWREKYRS